MTFPRIYSLTTANFIGNGSGSLGRAIPASLRLTCFAGEQTLLVFLNRDLQSGRVELAGKSEFRCYQRGEMRIVCCRSLDLG